MSLWMILKVFADACLLFGLLGTFPTYFVHDFSLFWPAALSAAGAGMAAFLSSKGKERLRWIAILIPACSFLLPDNGAELRILIPVILYAGLVILRGQFALEYYSYRQYFIRSLTIAGSLYLLLSIFSFLEGIGEESQRTIYAQEMLRFGLVYLLSGVILLRQLRLGSAEHASGSRGQMIAVLSCTALAILGFLAVEPMLHKGAAAVFNAILVAVFSVIMLILNGFQSVLNQVEIQAMNEQVQAHRGNSDTPVMGPVVQYIQQAAQSAEEATTSYWWVWLIVILLVVFGYLLLRSYRRGTQYDQIADTVLAVDAPAYGRQDSRRSNRGKVRHYYREFLRMERKRGLKLQIHYTTEDILQRISNDTNPAGASQLRQIYLQARYDEEHDITPEQVEAAKNALRRSRGGQNAKV